MDGVLPYHIYLEKFKHFSERLKERYNLDIDVQEYLALSDNICAKNGLFSINENATLIRFEFKDTVIYGIYSKSEKLLITALPHDVESNLDQTLKACFKMSNFPIVSQLSKIIIGEINSYKYDFETDKDAAIHYFKDCNYPTLAIEKFKFSEIRNIKICHEIRKIIKCEHPRVELSLKTKVKS